MTASQRAVAQHCPYCGETNLWPHEASHGAWECRDCGRVFSVSFLGLSGSAVTTAAVGPAPASGSAS